MPRPVYGPDGQELRQAGRDPERIKQVLALVATVWYSNPDLRFMQLVGALYAKSGCNPGVSGDFFYTEDDEFIDKVTKLIEDNSNAED